MSDEIKHEWPLFEVFVFSPRMEGVHLRMGHVARGGIRWSDRREDFRTEVLGLMKAQQVKNTVIVPVGAKGGFVVRRLPVEREAQQAEVLRSLPPREREVIELRFGLRDGQPRTLDEVARCYGITRERIRQIEARSLLKLRQPLRSQRLAGFAEKEE